MKESSPQKFTVADLKAWLETCPNDAILIVHHRLKNTLPHKVVNTHLKIDNKDTKVIAVCLN